MCIYIETDDKRDEDQKIDPPDRANPRCKSYMYILIYIYICI